MPSWFPFPIVLAFVLSASLTPVVIWLANKFGVVDNPTGGRKIHTLPTPLLGGASIYLAIALPLFLVTTFSTALTNGAMHAEQILGFLLGGLTLIVGGYLDDRYILPPKLSIIFPVIAAAIAVIFGIGVTKITNPFGGFVFVLPVVSMAFTFFWLLFMTYATKLMDGIDGLVTSVSLIGTLMIVALTVSQKYFQPDASLMALIIGAALCGFWLWNLFPAHIFLGEGGSTFIGFTLGVLAVIAGGKLATTLLVLGIPLLDMFCVMARRLLEGRSITSGDRYHLHHLLFDAGLSERQVVTVYSSLCLLFGVTTLVFTSFEKMLVLAALSLVVILLIIVLNRRRSLI